jgi:CubicO group peptidase (beta-lactamase class C family)
VPIFSATKAWAALVVRRLIDAGAFTLETPVAALWPAFSEAGKEAITIGQVLDHRAGLPWLGVGTRLALDQDAWERAIEAAPPLHAAGERRIYHAATQGFILDAIALRTTGAPIAELFDRWFARPLGLAARIGVDEAVGEHLARIVPPGTPGPPPSTEAVEQLLQLLDPPDFNRPDFLAARSPAANGIAAARDLAGLYAALLDGRAGLSGDALARLTAPRWDGVEEVWGLRWRMGGGMMLAGGFAPLGWSRRAFGYPGRGGATGFADPEHGVALGYLPNRPDPRPGAPRLVRLLEHVAAALNIGPGERL